ncbi:hypothetical protein AXK11_00260 [Cephaloticoccus primus]|uniref:Uncharacterized protein n=1 Tax=Cephaloticoccus primus TaxID=1548207 RepID=A0A139ST95_9BACT|nr:hypothetical protein [Cephaloticoccus primus]KXU37702.1 hypothetical protein AXK11_00260 [Cephaloticoccus primus]
MAATEESFKDYKRVEKKALELLAEMRRAAGPGGQKVDIELALLVAIFELHKDELPPQTIGSIVQGHLKQIIPYYSARETARGA